MISSGDSIWHPSDSKKHLSGQRFSTFDRDQDSFIGHCSQHFGDGGGWWFNSCLSGHLNGIYITPGNMSSGRGIIWSPWKGSLSLKRTEMKIRPNY